MKVFSPTSTERFMRCPRLYDRNKRWGKWEGTQAQNLGKAVHAGILAKYQGVERTPLDPVIWEAIGGDLPIDAAQKIVDKGVAKALALGLKGEVVHQEEPLGSEGCIPDLVLRDSRGLRVIDWKFTETTSDWVIQKRLNEAETSWQLKHYAWRVSQLHPGELVYEAGIVLIVASKSKAYWSPAEFTPALIADFDRVARQKWWEMEQAIESNVFPAHFGPSCTAFGGCPLYDGCYRDPAGDESKYHNLYERRPDGTR
jgi:hypothetical protein